MVPRDDAVAEELEVVGFVVAVLKDFDKGVVEIAVCRRLGNLELVLFSFFRSTHVCIGF
jgi:hypothetical protein